MAKIRAMFEMLGFSAVSTYLNSGNVLFESDKDCTTLQAEIVAKFWQEFGFEIPTLVKTTQQMKEIASVIPAHWQNDDTQKPTLPTFSIKSTLRA